MKVYLVLFTVIENLILPEIWILISISLPKQILLVTFSLCDLLMTTVTHISSYHVKQLAEFLWQKSQNGSNVMTLE